MDFLPSINFPRAFGQVILRLLLVMQVSSCTLNGYVLPMNDSSASPPGLPTQTSKPPDSVSLVSPLTSPGNNQTPVIRIGGVTPGNRIKLYTSSSCLNQVAEGIANSETIDLTTSPLTDGTYDFYANSTDPEGLVSACTSTHVIYVLDSQLASILYSQPTFFESKGTPNPPLSPAITNPASVVVNNFTISPDLPDGLSIDSNTGIISGTPLQISPVVTYTISALSGSIPIATTINFEVPISLAVVSSSDLADANPGDGICSSGSSGCTLRAAVQEAAALPAGVLTRISVPAGTYTFTNGIGLQISSRVEMSGAGAAATIISGSNTLANVINVNTLLPVTIDGIAVTNGRPPGSGNFDGVGLKSVSNDFTLKNCEISGNSVQSSAVGIVKGVGLSWMGQTAASRFLMDNCLITNNFRINSSANEETYGGGVAIDGNGQFRIQNSTISNNTVQLTGMFAKSKGGGLYITLPGQIADSTISGNIQQSSFAAHGGGGLFFSNFLLGQTMSLLRTIVSGNSGRYGGGIQHEGIGHLSLVDTTIENNNASALAGGLYLNSSGTFDILRSTFRGGNSQSDFIYHTTISNTLVSSIKNSTFYGSGSGTNLDLNGGSYLFEHVTIQYDNPNPGKALSVTFGILTLKHSIIDVLPTMAVACSISGSTMTSAGYNIARDSSCSFLNQASDRNNTNPILTALSSNGGFTQTMCLDASSPAIDQIPFNSISIFTDQRGRARPSDSGGEAGACEY
jgi:hypothetical protein